MVFAVENIFHRQTYYLVKYKLNMTGKDVKNQINAIRDRKDQMKIPLDKMMLIDRNSMTEFMDDDVITEDHHMKLENKVKNFYVRFSEPPMKTLRMLAREAAEGGGNGAVTTAFLDLVYNN